MSIRSRPSRRRDATVALTIALLTACEESPSDAATGEDDALLAVTLPDDEACDDVRQWPRERREQEAEMFAAIARVREQGGTCPDAQRFARETAPQTEGALVCAARNFSVYLEAFDKLGHTDGDGANVVDRLADAGWDTLLATELVAAADGDLQPARVVDEIWLASAPHCNALRARAWTHVGIGYIENTVLPDPEPDAPMTYGAYWVVVLSTAP